MAPETWERSTHAVTRSGHFVAESAQRARHWATIGSEHVTSMRTARIEPWRLLFAIIAVTIPCFILFMLDPEIDPAIPALFVVLAVAISTYSADWLGGATCAIVGLATLDLGFMGEAGAFDVWRSHRNIVLLVALAAVCACLISLFEHLKYDRASARLEAAAMRAANTAFNAVEIAAASRPAGDSEAFVHVLESILTAMVRVNRASAGALYLVDSPNKALIQAAVYGGPLDDLPGLTSEALRTIPIDEGFAGQIARERRPVAIANIAEADDVPDVISTNPYVQSAVGVPIFGPTDALAGVAWVGLYVPYRFSQTAIARLQALAHRTVAFMESARIADAQEELLDRVQGNHRRLQSVIQTMPEAVMVARPPSGHIVTSNAAAQRMFGLQASPTQVSTRRVDQLWVRSQQQGRQQATMPMMQAMVDGVTVSGIELEVKTPDGSWLPVVASAAPLRTETGDVDAVVGVFQNVGPLKEAERLRDEFISVVSHELRSPLTPIRGFAQIMERELEREGGHDQHVRWLRILQTHTDRLTRLVDDLLDVSRMRSGRLNVVATDADLVTIIRGVVDSKIASQSTHRIVFESEIESLPMSIDNDRIHQVIDNLVANAIKYTEGGTITVRLRIQGATVLIDVIDQGAGIPELERDALFTAFYRARSANESAVPGLGLGLFIVRELVRAHGGSISVADAPGGGAQFSVALPLVASSQVA